MFEQKIFWYWSWPKKTSLWV